MVFCGPIKLRDPGINQSARRIDLQVFAIHAKRRAIGANTDARPLAPDANVAMIFREAIHALLTPPLRRLGRIGDRLKHALGWRGNENFCSDNVLVGSNCASCHRNLLIIFRFY
jgi:hypothetical protein